MGKKTLKHLGFGSLTRYLSEYCKKITDKRGRRTYTIHDTVMSAYAMFMFKEKSLLDFQRKLQEEEKRNNLSTIFKVKKIPSDNQMRNILDRISPEVFHDVFHEFFRRLQRGKHLEQYRVLDDHYVISIDGSEYFRSDKISCSHCLRQKDKGQYYHTIVQATLVKPGLNIVIPLPPEEVRNEDGTEKQDCERNAAKRLIPRIRKAHPKLKILINADGLYSNVPFLKCLEEHNMNFISVVKKGDHKFLFDWIRVNDEKGLNSNYEVMERRNSRQGEKIRKHQYKWCNGVPLNGQMKKEVNFFEYTLINEKGKKGYHSTWITDVEISEKNMEELVKVARSRWKIENEGFNILKNHGYHIDHNFGHGKENLSMVFFILNILAFLTHEIQRLTNDRMIEYFSNNPRFTFFDTIQVLINIFVFEEFEELTNFIVEKRKFLLVPI